MCESYYNGGFYEKDSSFPVSQALLTVKAKTEYNHPEMNI
jgi:hypothetical protein